MNSEVVKAMREKGAKAVALEQKVSVYALFRQKAAWLAEHPEDRVVEPTGEAPEQSPQPVGTGTKDSSGG